MSILVDWQIRSWAANCGIEPYDADCVNAASIDLKIGDEFVDLISGDKFTSPSVTIKPGDAILATTMEYVIIPATLVGKVFLKSSRAREGLDHALAGFVDPGFNGQLTLELHAHREVTLHAGQRVIQLELSRTDATPERPYNGRYQGQQGPTRSRDGDST